VGSAKGREGSAHRRHLGVDEGHAVGNLRRPRQQRPLRRAAGPGPLRFQPVEQVPAPAELHHQAHLRAATRERIRPPPGRTARHAGGQTDTNVCMFVWLSGWSAREIHRRQRRQDGLHHQARLHAATRMRPGGQPAIQPASRRRLGRGSGDRPPLHPLAPTHPRPLSGANPQLLSAYESRTAPRGRARTSVVGRLKGEVGLSRWSHTSMYSTM
jgi:hypothetical protein